MTRRDVRALSIGGAAVAVLLVCFRVLPALRSELSLREARLDRELARLSRARVETSHLQALADSIAGLEAIGEALPRVLLAGGDAPTASFDLTRRLSLILARPEAFVSSIEPQTPEEALEGPLAIALVRASLEADAVALASILTELESDSALAIQGVEVRPVNARDTAAVIERLEVSLTVRGRYRPARQNVEPDTTQGGGS